MNHIKNLKRFRVVLLQADYEKNHNDQLFKKILETDLDLQSRINSFKYYISQIKIQAFKDDFINAIAKDDYDASMCEKYNIEVPEHLLNPKKNDLNLFEEMEKVAIIEINYYGRLNECYKKELGLKESKTL